MKKVQDRSNPIVSPDAVERAKEMEKIERDRNLCLYNRVCPQCAHDIEGPKSDARCKGCGAVYSLAD